jgi:predicted DNA-binding transcriptional regulator AlpA
MNKQTEAAQTFPLTGLVRVSQIVGDKKKGVPPFIPISKNTWWVGVNLGRYPKGMKLSSKVTVWRAEEVRAILDKMLTPEECPSSNPTPKGSIKGVAK